MERAEMAPSTSAHFHQSENWGGWAWSQSCTPMCVAPNKAKRLFRSFNSVFFWWDFKAAHKSIIIKLDFYFFTGLIVVAWEILDLFPWRGEIRYASFRCGIGFSPPAAPALGIQTKHGLIWFCRDQDVFKAEYHVLSWLWCKRRVLNA